jgi:hypothetical protein
MTKEDLIDKLSNQAKKFRLHLSQIPEITLLFKEVMEIIGEKDIFTFKEIPELSKIIILRISVSNFDILDSLITDLNERNFTTVDVLSRVSIEYSINIMYILYNDDGTRAKAYLNNYITQHQKKASKWNDFNVKNSKDTSISSQLINEFSHTRDLMINTLDLKNYSWVNVRERFKACNLEEDYLTIYSSASDSIHTISEDTFNYVFTFLSEVSDIKEELREFHNSERRSFSIYLSLNALKFLLFSAITILEKTNILETKNILEKKLNVVAKLLQLHDDEIVDFRKSNSNNCYE